ncbi:MAG: hypothetical protein Q9176_005022 [Flavoplaca citrina]
MPAPSPPSPLRNLLPTILLVSILYTSLATAAEPYTLNPNNIICSPSFFGSPTPADCTSALSTLATDEAVQRFLFITDVEQGAYQALPSSNTVADIYILLSSTTSTAYTMNPANQPKNEWSDEPPAEEADGATGEGGLKADPHAYFRGSFWGGGIGQINITDLPGHPDLASIPFPPSAYTAYTPAEKAYCTAAPPTCEEDTECCGESLCAV